MEPILLSLDKVLQLYGYIPKISSDAFGMFWLKATSGGCWMGSIVVVRIAGSLSA